MFRRIYRGILLGLLSLLIVVTGLQLWTPEKAYASGGAVVQGKTYGEWSALWWQWVLSIPAAVNPLTDDTGANAGVGQSGPVFFLVGFWGRTTQPITRVVAISSKKYIFFPIINQFAGDNPEYQPTDYWRNSVFKAINPLGSNLICTLDGVPVVFNPDTPIVRTQSPVFTFTLPPNNIFNADPGEYGNNVSDGYWVMLTPLEPGPHTLHFQSATPKNLTYQDITYHLTVK